MRLSIPEIFFGGAVFAIILTLALNPGLILVNRSESGNIPSPPVSPPSFEAKNESSGISFEVVPVIDQVPAKANITANASVFISVYTPRNVPISGATVYFRSLPAGTLIARRTTDYYGNANFSRKFLSDRNVTVHIRMREYGSGNSTVSLSPGKNVSIKAVFSSNGSVGLARSEIPPFIIGVFDKETNSSIEGANITVLNSLKRHFSSAMTGEEGEAEFFLLPGGYYAEITYPGKSKETAPFIVALPEDPDRFKETRFFLRSSQGNASVPLQPKPF